MAKNIGLENFLVFGAPDIQSPEIRELLDCLESTWLGTGPRVARFEQDFAAYKGLAADHGAAVNSCTAASHVSMIAAGIGPGDEVITTPMTFCATVNAIIDAGATPVLAVVDPVTMNIDPDAVAASITPRTRAILPVHFAGRPCEMDALVALADRHGLRIIEDAAHAIETEYHGRRAGTFGDFGCFSFYVTKNFATGEGGMVAARYKADIHRIKALALRGMTKDAWHRYGDKGFRHYQVVEAGFEYNMMDLHAAIGIHQLQRVERGWERRREIWNRYQDAFAALPETRPADPEPNTQHAFRLYTLLIDEARCGMSRDAFLEAMTARGIGVPHLSLAEHPHYRERFGWRASYYAAELIGCQTVSLPLSPKLTNDNVARVIEAVRSTIKSGASASLVKSFGTTKSPKSTRYLTSDCTPIFPAARTTTDVLVGTPSVILSTNDRTVCGDALCSSPLRRRDPRPLRHLGELPAPYTYRGRATRSRTHIDQGIRSGVLPPARYRAARWGG